MAITSTIQPAHIRADVRLRDERANETQGFTFTFTRRYRHVPEDRPQTQ